MLLYKMLINNDLLSKAGDRDAPAAEILVLLELLLQTEQKRETPSDPERLSTQIEAEGMKAEPLPSQRLPAARTQSPWLPGATARFLLGGPFVILSVFGIVK
jgi:hypothetical protein